MDQSELDDNLRCQMIGHAASKGIVIGVVFEDAGKVDRYVKIITEAFPDVRVIDKTLSGLPSGLIIVRFGLKAKH